MVEPEIEINLTKEIYLEILTSVLKLYLVKNGIPDHHSKIKLTQINDKLCRQLDFRGKSVLLKKFRFPKFGKALEAVYLQLGDLNLNYQILGDTINWGIF